MFIVFDICVDSYQWNIADYIRLTIGPLQHAKVFSCFHSPCASLADHSKHGGSHWQQDEVAQSICTL